MFGFGSVIVLKFIEFFEEIFVSYVRECWFLKVLTDDVQSSLCLKVGSVGNCDCILFLSIIIII